jgi:hypothetical protein
MYISRDVVFHESTFPFSSNSSFSITHLQSSYTLLPSSLQLLHYQVSPQLAAPDSTNIAVSPNSVSNLSSNDSISVSGSPHSLSPRPCPAPTWIHQIFTRAQNQIVMPRVFTDGRVKYPYLSCSTSCTRFNS